MFQRQRKEMSPKVKKATALFNFTNNESHIQQRIGICVFVHKHIDVFISSFDLEHKRVVC